MSQLAHQILPEFIGLYMVSESIRLYMVLLWWFWPLAALSSSLITDWLPLKRIRAAVCLLQYVFLFNCQTRCICHRLPNEMCMSSIAKQDVYGFY